MRTYAPVRAARTQPFSTFYPTLCFGSNHLFLVFLYIHYFLRGFREPCYHEKSKFTARGNIYLSGVEGNKRSYTVTCGYVSRVSTKATSFGTQMSNATYLILLGYRATVGRLYLLGKHYFIPFVFTKLSQAMFYQNTQRYLKL